MITDDTGTQGMAGNQIEIGYDHDDADGVAGHSFPVTYSRGVTDALDVMVSTTRLGGPVRGWSNPGVGAKWRFYDNSKSGLSLGLEPTIQFPVSAAEEADGLGNGKTCYSLIFLLTQNTGFGQLMANLEVARNDFADAGITDRKTNYRLSVAPVVDVAPGWRVALDIGIETNPDRGQKYRMGYVELGAVYSPGPSVDLSAGVIHDILDGPVRNTTVTTEVAWRF